MLSKTIYIMSINSPETIEQPDAKEHISGKADLFLDIDGDPDLGEHISKSIVAEGSRFGRFIQSEVIGIAPECRLRVSASFQEMGMLVDFIEKIKQIYLECREAMLREAGKYRDAITSVLPVGSKPVTA